MALLVVVVHRRGGDLLFLVVRGHMDHLIVGLGHGVIPEDGGIVHLRLEFAVPFVVQAGEEEGRPEPPHGLVLQLSQLLLVLDGIDIQALLVAHNLEGDGIQPLSPATAGSCPSTSAQAPASSVWSAALFGADKPEQLHQADPVLVLLDVILPILHQLELELHGVGAVLQVDGVGVLHALLLLFFNL